MKEELVYCGVDIAKSYLDAAIGNEQRRFCNDAVGHGELIHWIKQVPGSVQVICDLRSPAPLRKMSAAEKGSAVLGCNATVSV